MFAKWDKKVLVTIIDSEGINLQINFE